MASRKRLTIDEKRKNHLQTEPGVKSEWLNGLESVLMKKIENERKTQPRITQFFHQRQGQSGQASQSNDNNNSNDSDEIHFIGTY